MVVDIIFAAILLYAVISGAWKGLVVQITELLAFLVGIYISYKFSYLLAEWAATLHTKHINPLVVATVSFALTFILTAAGVSLLGRIIHKVVHLAMIGWLNRLLGGVFATLKMLFLTSVALFILNMINLQTLIIPQKYTEESMFYPFVSDFAPCIFTYLDIDKLKDMASFDK